MKKLRLHIPTFALHLLVIAGFFCLLSPNIVEANRQQSFREWLESSQSEDQNRAEQDDQTQQAYLYQTWSDFHQSVTLGQAVLAEIDDFTSNLNVFEYEPEYVTGHGFSPSLITSFSKSDNLTKELSGNFNSLITVREARLSSTSINAP